MIKPAQATNHALYDKTQNSGNKPSFIANIKELLTAQKGTGKGARPQRQTIGKRQASAVQAGSAIGQLPVAR